MAPSYNNNNNNNNNNNEIYIAPLCEDTEALQWYCHVNAVRNNSDFKFFLKVGNKLLSLKLLDDLGARFKVKPGDDILSSVVKNYRREILVLAEVCAVWVLCSLEVMCSWRNVMLHFTARCDASAVFAVMQCLSVRLSVTFVDHVRTNKHIFDFFHHRVATPF